MLTLSLGWTNDLEGFVGVLYRLARLTGFERCKGAVAEQEDGERVGWRDGCEG
jgi:hypothetical protein